MLKIYSLFFKDLSSSGVPYCSWKNNHLLKDELSGDGDIDLLVHPHYKHAFEYILNEHGFIKANSPISEYPHIVHFYAYDSSVNKFAHIHVYYKLVTGDSHLKNYRFPLESQILDSSKTNALGVKEAAIHHQIQLYIIRQVIKKSSLLGRFLLFREKKDYSDELKYISNQLTEKNISFSLLGLNVTISENYSVSLLNQIYLKWYLRSWHRGSGMKDRLSQLNKRVINKLFLKKNKYIEGSIIAIVGLDGSGKTTAVEMIYKWLSKEFNVKTFHFGRPPPTFITLPLRLVLFIRKKLGQAKPIGSLGDTSKNLNLSVLGKIRYIALAYERNALMKKAHQYSLKGGISILDRYPSLCIGLMDSPRIIPNEKSNFTFLSILYKIESTLYKSMPLADLLFKFEVNIENALIRNRNRVKEGKETDDEIRQRFKINMGLKYNTLKLTKIDANNQMDQVHQQLYNKIWKHIVATN